MTLHSSGYFSDPTAQETEAKELQLFIDNLALIRQYEHEILACRDYFFCGPSFAWCSWPYISGDGPLYLGYLLLGWQNGLMREQCPTCDDRLLIVSFGGFLFSGRNSCYGYCPSCRQMQASSSTSKAWNDRRDFITNLRQELPPVVSHWEEYEGLIFSWGGNGTKPATKKRLVQT